MSGGDAPGARGEARPARVRSVVALAAALLLTAVLFDAEPLYVPGLALLLLAAAAVAWVRLPARGLRVRRTLGARRVTEGGAVAVTLEVRAGRLPLPAGRILDPLLGRALALPAGRAAARVRTEVRFPRRGRRRLAPARVEIADPLGVAARTADAPTAGDDELLVLPAVHPVRAAGAAGDGRPVLGVRVGAGAETELDGVATLREGTPASRIFWPAIARGAEPMERRLVAEDDPRPLVILDAGGEPSEEDLDAAVRAVASLAVALARGGGCAVLLPGDRRPADLDAALHRWPALHARLAVIGPGGRPRVGAATTRRGALVLVAARAPARPPGALTHAPAGAARLLVIPATARPPGAPRVAFTVAGCTGYDLSTHPTRAAGRRRKAAR